MQQAMPADFFARFQSERNEWRLVQAFAIN